MTPSQILELDLKPIHMAPLKYGLKQYVKYFVGWWKRRSPTFFPSEEITSTPVIRRTIVHRLIIIIIIIGTEGPSRTFPFPSNHYVIE